MEPWVFLSLPHTLLPPPVVQTCPSLKFLPDFCTLLVNPAFNKLLSFGLLHRAKYQQSISLQVEGTQVIIS